MNTSSDTTLLMTIDEAAGTGNTEWSTLHCSKDALTDLFGWFLQGILATLAFTCLIGKRFCEPLYSRRSWETWWYDTSKQGIGALVIHMTNVYLAPLFQGDPCTWYIINFLLDSTIGLFIIYIGIKTCQYLARKKKWDAINFGEYGAPKSWLYQTWIYVGLMAIVKLITTLFIQLDVWDNVKNFVLSPFKDPRIELAVVMLVIPFFVNILIFWVTDNFLMRHARKKRNTGATHHNHGREHNLLQKVKYKMIQKSKPNDSESDTLLSGDEEILNYKPSSSGTSSSLLHHVSLSGAGSSSATILDDTAIILTSSTAAPSSKQNVQQRTSVINV
ncbi:store-operated calcium entry regulator STIMATE-like [Uranotaenia lowii]|uniref:store-operated calcium entry regulator STIMATE-like n=1 Tax=Uranotaenia lowii TaxID=190385 RepID=UPI00247A197C|nr:store-operated calcium entry regulator STIMATE-like [Uranotaenia lowii]